MSGEHRARRGGRRWLVPGVTLLVAVVAASMVVLAESPEASSASKAALALAAPRGGLAALDLSAEQLQRIAEIRQEAYQQAIPIQGELYTLRQQLALALRGAQIDAQQVKDLAGRIHELQGKLQEIQLQMLLDIHGVLTDEQRSQLSAYGGLGLGPWGAWDGWGVGPRRGVGMHMMGRGWRR